MENGVPKSSWKNAKVVELGAGIGFSGLVSHQLGATDVTITDGNIDVLKLADENIIQNIDSNRIKQVRTAQLRWGTDDEKNFINQESSPKSPDFILVSDCTYKKAAWPDLIGTIAHLSGTNTKTILSMEPRNVGEVEGVINEAKKQGLVVVEKRLPVDPVKTQCSLLCARLFELTKA